MGFQWLDIALFQIHLDVIIQLPLFSNSKGVDFTIKRFWGVFCEFNGNIPRLMFWESCCFCFGKDLFPFVIMGWDSLILVMPQLSSKWLSQLS